MAPDQQSKLKKKEKKGFVAQSKKKQIFFSSFHVEIFSQRGRAGISDHSY